jgi:hypothetical protein
VLFVFAACSGKKPAVPAEPLLTMAEALCDPGPPVGPAVRRLQWQPVAGATGYQVHRDAEPHSAVLGATAKEYLSKVDVVEGRTYACQVAAKNVMGTSFSPISNVKVPVGICGDKPPK